MDPLSVITATIKIGDVAFRLASSLYAFVRDVRQIDATISDLASELHTLGSTCEAVHTQLSEIVQQYDSDQAGGTTKLWSLTQAELDHCQRTMKKLDIILDNVRHQPGNVAGQAIRQVKLNISKSEIVETRSLIRSHTTTLQISLQIINITVSHLAPKQADQALLTKLDILQQSVDSLLKQRDETQNNVEPAKDDALMQQANEVLSSGASLYEASVAGGSVISESILKLQHKRKEQIPDWIKNVQTLQLDNNTSLGSPVFPQEVHSLPGGRRSLIGLKRAQSQDRSVSTESHHERQLSSRQAIPSAPPNAESSSQLAPRTAAKITHGVDNQSGSIQNMLAVGDLSVTSVGIAAADSGYRSSTDDSARIEASGLVDQTEDAADWDVEFEVGVAKQSLQLGESALSHGNYQVAYDLLQAAVELIEEIPPDHRSFYKPHRLQFDLALCVFYLRNAEESEAVLVSFLERPAVSTKEDSLLLCDAGHLLSQVYIRLGKLDLAKSTCHGSARGRWKLLGDQDDRYFDSLSLLARIYELQNNSTRSKVYASMVPASSSRYLSQYASLEPETVEHSDFDEGVAQANEISPPRAESSHVEGFSSFDLPESTLADDDRTGMPLTPRTESVIEDDSVQNNVAASALSSNRDEAPVLRPEQRSSNSSRVTISDRSNSSQISNAGSSSATRSMMRFAKNVTKGYSTVQVKVRDATSNDPSYATASDMWEIALFTPSTNPANFYDTVDMIERRLRDSAKNWRHILKSLRLLLYLLYRGSDICVTWARKYIHLIESLRGFVDLDNDATGVGKTIRELATSMVFFIRDEARVLEARQNPTPIEWFREPVDWLPITPSFQRSDCMRIIENEARLTNRR